MRARGAGMQFAQDLQFRFGRRRGLRDLVGVLTVQPVLSWICSRVTPGWIETTVISLDLGIGLEDARDR